MTGVEWILLLIGSVFLIGSFFVTEKLSPSELNKIAELSEDELRKIIERGLSNAKERIEESIDTQLEASTDKVDRALEKETNEKIMAISEYSDTVVESMNKTHNEIMFLYSMLNDKHTELTGMVSDLQRLAADVRSLEESCSVRLQKPQMTETVIQAEAVMPEQKVTELSETEMPSPRADEAAETVKQPENKNQEILVMHKEGASEVEIARTLGMGVGEVRLIIGLYRGE